MNCEEIRSLLNAYADEEVDSTRRAPIAAHITECASCGELLTQIEHIRNSVRSEITYREAPPGLEDRIRFALRASAVADPAPPAANWRAWGAVAAVLLVGASISTPILLRDRAQRQSVANELFSAHMRSLLGRDLDVVSSDRHTVKPWFNGKLPFSPPVSDPKADGFPLEGGRLDYLQGRPIAALVYRRALHRIDVFVWPSDQGIQPSPLDRDGFHEITWRQNGFDFAAISDLNAAELSHFADLLKAR